MSGMTPKTRRPDENTVVWSTTAATISSASRRRCSRLTVGSRSGASSSRWWSEDLDVIETGEVDERLDEDVLLQIAARLRDLADLRDRDGGRERTVLQSCCVDELNLRDGGVPVDELDPERAAVGAPLQDSGRLALLDPHAHTRPGVLDQEHRRPVACH